MWAGLLIHFCMVPGECGHCVLPDTFPGHAPTLSHSGVGGQGASSKEAEPLDNQLHPGLPITQMPEPFSEPHGPERKLPGGTRPTQTRGPGGGLGEAARLRQCADQPGLGGHSGPVQAEALGQHGGLQVLVLLLLPQPLLLQQGHQRVSLLHHLQHLVQDPLLLCQLLLRLQVV